MNLSTKVQHAFENYQRKEVVKPSSDRSFGVVFTGFFFILGYLSYKTYNFSANPWFYLALLLLICTLLKPSLLAPFNRLWTQFGLILHRIMNPLIMGVLFFGIMTPMAVIARACSWDPLRLKFDSKLDSYWIMRNQDQSSNASSLKNQF
jgi:hypothetical protein